MVKQQHNEDGVYIRGQLAKPLIEFPEYLARADGTIWYRSKKGKNKGRMIKRKSFKSNAGYQTLSIGSKKQGTRRTRTLHLLVLEAWRGKKPSAEYECAHYDGNKNNNAISNLRWAKRGSFSDVFKAEPNSFFELTNGVDTWFAQKKLESENPNSDVLFYELTRPVKL